MVKSHHCQVWLLGIVSILAPYFNLDLHVMYVECRCTSILLFEGGYGLRHKKSANIVVGAIQSLLVSLGGFLTAQFSWLRIVHRDSRFRHLCLLE